MKHFALGLLCGGIAGLLSSFLKDKNGQRVGQPLKDEVDGLKKDGTDLRSALKKAKYAKSRLAQEMPAARRALSDMHDEVKHYQQHSKRIVQDLQHQSRRIQAEVNGPVKKN